MSPACRLHQIWTGSFSTVTEAQSLISAGAHCWAPAASGNPGSRTVTVWWPPQPPKQEATPPSATPVPKEEGKQQEPGFKSETLQILSRVGEAPPAEKAKEEKKEKDVDRNWTMAEQLRHPVGIVSLQWTPGSLQRGVSCAFNLSLLYSCRSTAYCLRLDLCRLIYRLSFTLQQ